MIVFWCVVVIVFVVVDPMHYFSRRETERKAKTNKQQQETKKKALSRWTIELGLPKVFIATKRNWAFISTNDVKFMCVCAVFRWLSCHTLIRICIYVHIFYIVVRICVWIVVVVHPLSLKMKMVGIWSRFTDLTTKFTWTVSP